MDYERLSVKFCRKWESVRIVTEHMSNIAEKWESAWIVTEHLLKTEDKWVISMDCDRTYVNYCRKIGISMDLTEHVKYCKNGDQQGL